ncbi:FN3 domain-containing metallophosphoesterase family protein [Curtobacterium sp. MCSS17_007]|uniref:FN3 domain-containing metallophosphoesterase family protein n=1 Tax=Curtobacterium sp. MCSS17_007 TaxID=2175646 RepID=UPI000DA82B27|nr:FN3 domain-containing metallophosphoesterase family protein [Curtobacterium sp. MCSS17_007]WIE76285.1 metallophosphoesterase [Curtobacterium sp. MCSS17_007]
MTSQHPARRRRTARTVGAATAALAAIAASTMVGSVPSASAEEAPLIASGTTTWQYLEDGSDPAAGQTDRTAWTTGALPSGDWKTGAGSFGAKNGSATGMGGGHTVDTLLEQYLADGKDVPTYFFRTSFEADATDLATWRSLTAEVTYDDALVVFVNGQRVAGFEDSGVAQNVQYAGDNGGDPDESTFSIDASVLHEGTNDIAVALYQGRSNSSDVYFDMESLVPVAADVPAQISDVVMTVGSDERSRNLAWYSDSTAAEVAQVVPASQLVDGAFPAAGATEVASTSGTATDGQQYHHATLGGLAASTEYAYRVGSESDGWSPVTTFRTGDGDGDYSFIFIGDAQIGASGDAAADTQGWKDTLDTAERAFPDTEMVFSAGDQVNTASNEAQYEGFLSPDQLRRIPLVTNIGNHDVASLAYEQHFALPNVSSEHGKPDATRAGGDYWFVHGDTLYISFNSNDKDDAGHAEFARKVLEEHGDEARWKVVTFHHSVYSTASHSDDSDIITRRADLPPALSALDVDLVLMGHDHVYVRSYLMSGTTPVGSGAPAETVTPTGDEVLYVTANSSSGSKYYDIKPGPFDFAAVQNQEYTPNFTNVEVSDDEIAMTTYRSADMSVVDRVTLQKPAEPTDPSDPGTDPADPADPGTDPADPADPGTDPADPGTDPTAPADPGAEPGTDPTAPADDAPVAADLATLSEATHTLRVDAVDEEAGTVTVTVPRALAGAPLDWFVHSDAEYLGDDPSDDDGVLTLRLPVDLEAGTHTLVAQRADGSVATWGTFAYVVDPVTGRPTGELALTGADVLPLAAGSALAVAAGLGIALAARRRRA